MGAPPATRSLNCPNCGAAMEIRGMARTLRVVCIQCLSILDAKDPAFAVLQRFQEKERIQPLIPLGRRGRLHGSEYEAIGFQERSIDADGVRYAWREYLLFNPYKGFRYLTEYDGHWNDVITISALPSTTDKTATYLSTKYKKFQTAQAVTDYVMGEFPWAVSVGETSQVIDYVAPPRMLSNEVTAGESTWSLGEYITGEHVWKAFALEGQPPEARGIYANQPSPLAGRVMSMWWRCAALVAALFVLTIIFQIFAAHQEVFKQGYSITHLNAETSGFVTDVFELKGRPSTVEVEIRTDLLNDWAWFDIALINEATGQAWDFGRQVEYYTQGGETEGDRDDSALVPSVPAGRYYLRVEPEMEHNPGDDRRYHYEIVVRRDVPSWSLLLIGAAVLLVPPVIRTIRSMVWEQRRWQESDVAGEDGEESEKDDE